jgi:hypothetical protein
MPTIDAFRKSTSDAAPPAGASPALEALWWARRGDWTKAHECVQAQEGDRDCDRVHAHLHRQEGDMSNAGWWYRRVGTAVPSQSLEAEWDALAAELLARG